MASMKMSTIVVASVGTIITGFLAYAVYFDHKRRTDVGFRKALKKENRRQEKVAREEAEAFGAKQNDKIRAAARRACEEGFPIDVEDKERYFMMEVAKGEAMCADGDPIEAGLCFYKALKVYPQTKELISIYDKTVPRHVLDIIAVMMAADPDLASETQGSEPANVE